MIDKTDPESTALPPGTPVVWCRRPRRKRATVLSQRGTCVRIETQDGAHTVQSSSLIRI